jgi:hypothetical protein
MPYRRAEQEILVTSTSSSTSISTSIRKFAYATLLALTTLNFVPTPVSAQEPARGKFTLPHEVRWENVVVPAGDYQFDYESAGAGILRLNKISGVRAGFMLLVRDTDETPIQTRTSGASQLVLETDAGTRYVSTLELPQFGMTLHFTVPANTVEKQIARAASAVSASAQ